MAVAAKKYAVESWYVLLLFPFSFLAAVSPQVSDANSRLIHTINCNTISVLKYEPW